MSETTGLTNRSLLFFFSSSRRGTRWYCDWSSDVCSSDLPPRKPFRDFLQHLDVAVGVAERRIRAVRSALRIQARFAPVCARTKTGAQSTARIVKDIAYRSEERRVGKEWRARRAAEAARTT